MGKSLFQPWANHFSVVAMVAVEASLSLANTRSCKSSHHQREMWRGVLSAKSMWKPLCHLQILVHVNPATTKGKCGEEFFRQKVCGSLHTYTFINAILWYFVW